MFRVGRSVPNDQPPNPYNTTRTRYPDPFESNEFKPDDDFASDEFRMFSFKIKKCPINRAHDWTVCPYAHRGERARRRDPLRPPFYAALACPDFRATGGVCPRGEACPYAHGVFEYWLHPARYRTRTCTAGQFCARPVCFFAHSPEQLRAESARNLPKWARVQARTGGGGSGSSSSTAGNVVGSLGPKLNLELLESLKKLGINEYYNNNIPVGKSNYFNNVYSTNNNVDMDAPNIDWITDLLAG